MENKDLVLKMVADGKLQSPLYKYRSLADASKEYTLDIFRKCELFFAAPSSFNDPFDCKFSPVIASVKNLASEIAKRQTLGYEPDNVERTILADSAIDANFVKAVDRVMNRHGICCFSRNDEEILMWSHYADCHKGICLEFDVSKDPDFFVFPKNVAYQDNYPKIDVSQPEGTNIYVSALLGTKYKKWYYEQEVRVYKEHHQAYHFNPASLVSVTFGCKTEAKIIEEVMSVVNANIELNHVRFYKTEMDKEAYKLNIVEL